MKKRRISLCLAMLIALGVAMVMTVLLPAIYAAHSTRTRVETELELHSIDLACVAYQKEFGGYPAGTASTILSALYGENPKKIVFLVPVPSADVRNSDPWGKEFRVLPGSDSKPQFYSTGPNQIDESGRLGSDDIHTRPHIEQEAQQAVSGNRR